MFFRWEIRAKLGGRRRKALRYRRKGDTAGIISVPSLLKDLPVPRCYWFLLSPVLTGVYTLSSSWYILPTCPPLTPLSLNLQHDPYLIWKALLFPKDEEGAPFSAPAPVCVSLFPIPQMFKWWLMPRRALLRAPRDFCSLPWVAQMLEALRRSLKVAH